MADHTIASDEEGVYEFPVAAGTTVTVAVDQRDFMEVMTHSGTKPVYALTGSTIRQQDPKAVIAPAGTYVTIPGNGPVIAVTSAADAVVSIYRGQ